MRSTSAATRCSTRARPPRALCSGRPPASARAAPPAPPRPRRRAPPPTRPRRRYVYAFYLPQGGNFRAHFEMNQTELEQQTDQLAGMLQRDVSEICRKEVVHCFQMAKTRLKNLFELVDVCGSGDHTDTSGGMAASSSAGAASSSGAAGAASS
jgi:hypothetical protein